MDFQQIHMPKKKKNPNKNKQMKNYDPYLTPHMKIKSKWITDLKANPQTKKLVEEIIFWMFTKITSFIKCFYRDQIFVSSG